MESTQARSFLHFPGLEGAVSIAAHVLCGILRLPCSLLAGQGPGIGVAMASAPAGPYLDVFFWGSSFNDGTTQTALDPLMLGGRLAPLKSVYFGSNEGRGPVPSVQP